MGQAPRATAAQNQCNAHAPFPFHSFDLNCSQNYKGIDAAPVSFHQQMKRRAAERKSGKAKTKITRPGDFEIAETTNSSHLGQWEEEFSINLVVSADVYGNNFMIRDQQINHDAVLHVDRNAVICVQAPLQLVQSQEWMVRIKLHQFHGFDVTLEYIRVLLYEFFESFEVGIRSNDFISHSPTHECVRQPFEL
jgi:hypothetical protein